MNQVIVEVDRKPLVDHLPVKRTLAKDRSRQALLLPGGPINEVIKEAEKPLVTKIKKIEEMKNLDSAIKKIKL